MAFGSTDDNLMFTSEGAVAPLTATSAEKIVISTDPDGPCAGRPGEHVLVVRARVHQVRDAGGVVPGLPPVLHDARGDVDVREGLHAAGGTSRVRPVASHAAYRR